MELERLSSNQIKYSIPIDELIMKGLTKDELFKQPEIWDSLFDEMLDEASKRFELDACEAVAVEIYSMTANELVLILTFEDECLDETTFIDEKLLHYTPTEEIKVMFDNFEDCLSFAKRLHYLFTRQIESRLYEYQSNYYLMLLTSEKNRRGVYALGEEYGEILYESLAIVEEYGNCIIEKRAIETLQQIFKS